jgi:hypothetical protein
VHGISVGAGIGFPLAWTAATVLIVWAARRA